MHELYEYMNNLLDQCASTFLRYAYAEISWDSRMIALVGPRGVGKTTLLLQRIRQEHADGGALYVTADHMYFAAHTLYEVAQRHVQNGGTHLFIDEVHKYEGWSRELKAVYDAFPDLHVCFTGSSVLDIEKGEADLSRRAPKYVMQGLSFREFLAIRYGIEVQPRTLEEILEGKTSVPGIAHPLPLFNEYLERGYYPFGSDPAFDIELGQVITCTLEVDIPAYANMTAASGRKLKRLLSTVSTLVPFKPNMSDLAKRVQVSRNVVEDYLLFLEKAGMIMQLRTGTKGLGALGKVEKVYLDNTNVLMNLGGKQADRGTIRETFFMNQVRVTEDVRASAVGDFEIRGNVFEVGGRSKTADQISGIENGYMVKDDIEYGSRGVIPLWAFGLMY